MGLIPGLRRSPGEGNGKPLQYSCLENPKNRGAWRAIIHGITKSQTQLSYWGHTRYLVSKFQHNFYSYDSQSITPSPDLSLISRFTFQVKYIWLHVSLIPWIQLFQNKFISLCPKPLLSDSQYILKVVLLFYPWRLDTFKSFHPFTHIFWHSWSLPLSWNTVFSPFGSEKTLSRSSQTSLPTSFPISLLQLQSIGASESTALSPQTSSLHYIHWRWNLF